MGVWVYHPSHLEPIMEQTGITFPIGSPMDPDPMKIYQRVHTGASWFPFEVLIDGTGKVTYMASDYDAEGLQAAIDKILPSK